MSVTAIDATSGSATANAYVTVAVADQYFADRPQYGLSQTTQEAGSWAAADTDSKAQAILYATKLMDRYFLWKGFVTSVTQRLLWPRVGLMDVNEWTVLDVLAIPQQVQWACAEYARQLLMTERTSDSDVETQGVRSIKAGSVQITFRDNVMAKPVPDIVARMIPFHWGYLRGSQPRRLERA